MIDDKNTHSREQLTVLLRRRSVIALCCGILTLILAFYGIIEGVNQTWRKLHENAFFSFIYFTMISNTLATLSVSFILPFAVEGVRKKRFILPRWVAVFHYIATVSVVIVMVIVLSVMSWASPEDAFGGPNLFTHIFCPLLILVSFFQIEGGHVFTVKDCLLAVIPGGVYMVVYFIEVVLVGEANGGWPDIYQITEHLPSALAIPAFLLIAFGVSMLIALLSNYLTKKRTKKMYSFWREDMDPIEVRIEAFGIGRMAAESGEESSIQIPYDILTYLAQKYDLKTDDLMKPYFKGLLTEIEDRNNKK